LQASSIKKASRPSAIVKSGALCLTVGLLLAGCVETTTETVTVETVTTSRAPNTGRGGVVMSNEQFPAISEARLQALTSNAHCATTITTIARTAAQTQTHQGYAIQICNADHEKEGHVVAWISNTGNSVIVTSPGGTPYVRRASNLNDGGQQVQWSIFAIRLQSGAVGCALPIHNRFTEPFAVAHCDALDS